MNLLKNNGQASAGVDTTTRDVEVELSDRDTHSTDAEVTKTKNTRAVGHNNDLGLVGGGGSILCENLADRALCFLSAQMHTGPLGRGTTASCREQTTKAVRSGRSTQTQTTRHSLSPLHSPCRQWTGRDPRGPSTPASTSGTPRRRWECTQWGR